ncbi:MAG: hypothetical protein ACKVOE_08000 [Rickettsiales bacterium]
MADKKTVLPPPAIIELPKSDAAKLDVVMRGSKPAPLDVPLPQEAPPSVMDAAREAAEACKAKASGHYCPSQQPSTGLNLSQDFTVAGVKGTATAQPGKGGGKIRVPFGPHQ